MEGQNHTVVPLTMRNAPIGTRAPQSWAGIGTEMGWKWNGPDGSGGTFPTPGGDWNGKLIPPALTDAKPAAEAVRASRAGITSTRTAT